MFHSGFIPLPEMNESRAFSQIINMAARKRKASDYGLMDKLEIRTSKIPNSGRKGRKKEKKHFFNAQK